MNTHIVIATLGILTLLSFPTIAAQAAETWPPPSFTVRWDPAPLPTYEGAEEPNPARYLAPDDPVPVWQAYEVSPGEEPRLLYETPRFLEDVNWEPDGTTVRIGTSSLVQPRSKYDIPHDIAGFTRIDLRSRAAEALLTQGNWPKVSPDGRNVALSLGGQTYLRQPGKPDRKLATDGKSAPFFGWTPDSRSILIWYPDPDVWPSRTGAVYLVPLEDGEARYLATMPDKPAWSHDGGRLAYIADGDVYVYDLAGRYSRRLAHGDTYLGGPPEWSEDDSMLIARGDVIDVASGKVLASLFDGEVVSRNLSPDGRYFAATDYAGGYTSSTARCPSRPPQNHLVVHDLLTGTTRTIHDCGGTIWHAGSAVLAGSNRLDRAVVSRRDCSNPDCRDSTSYLEILTLQDGATVEMGAASGTVSPDHHALLVSGSVLKVFSRDLELIREIPIPDGKRVSSVGWAPDSQRFVYVVGPEKLIAQ